MKGEVITRALHGALQEKAVPLPWCVSDTPGLIELASEAGLLTEDLGAK